MLYWLADLSSTLSIFNVFRYLTFRAGGAVVTALMVAFVFGPAIIRWLRLRQRCRRPRREESARGLLKFTM